ncbi:MAG TPA: alpha/beta hydrolase [Luteimonas sp.]|nr:alpha/beta hydrolase [Luteimonas sp.]
MAVATMQTRVATTQTRTADVRGGRVPSVPQLHLPPAFEADRGWPAVVLSTPSGSLGDQVGARYAGKLAGRGFIAVTVATPPACSHGRGAAHDGAHPATRVEALRRAVDHLVTLPFVDPERIAVLGICTGGSHAADAALAERRFKVVATVAGLDVCPALIANARGAPGRHLDRHSRTGARRLRGFGPMAGDEAFAHAPEPLMQPLMVIVGGGHGSARQYETGQALYGRARGPDRALVVISRAGHDDLQHRDDCIDPAIDRLAPFLHFHLDP